MTWIRLQPTDVVCDRCFWVNGDGVDVPTPGTYMRFVHPNYIGQMCGQIEMNYDSEKLWRADFSQPEPTSDPVDQERKITPEL